MKDLPPPFMREMFADTGHLYAYTGRPPPEVYQASSLAATDPWMVVAATLEQAKRRQHAPVRELLPIWSRSDLVLGRACLGLIGDAGDHAALEHAALEVLGDPDEDRVEICRAIALGGALWLAPLLAEAWATTRYRGDRDLVSLHIDELLGADLYTGNHDWTDEAYCLRVEERAAEVKAAIGSDRRPVWRGQLFGVRRLAEHMRGVLRGTRARDHYILGPTFIPLRHKFEAATGIDCSVFYRQRSFQSGIALAIVEGFLASPESAAYEDGVRYFFGHPVPD